MRRRNDVIGQRYVGTTPRGHEIYREVCGDRYFVRVPLPIDSIDAGSYYVHAGDGGPSHFVPLNTLRDLHCRKELGRFGSFTEAATFADATGGLA